MNIVSPKSLVLMRSYILTVCFVVTLSVMTRAAQPMGRRETPSLKLDEIELQIPTPRFVQRAWRQENNKTGDFEIKARLQDNEVKVILHVDSFPSPYMEYAESKERMRMHPDRIRGRRPNPEILLETAILICAIIPQDSPGYYTAFPSREYVSLFYLYGRTIRLSMQSNSPKVNELKEELLLWTQDFLQGNAAGGTPAIVLDIPGGSANAPAIPIPKELDRVISRRDGANLPQLVFVPLEENNSDASVVLATFSVLSKDAVSEADFVRMSPHYDRVFLEMPHGRVVKRDRERMNYAYGDALGRFMAFSVVCRVGNMLAKFDITYPPGDRQKREWALRNLDAWVEATREITREMSRDNNSNQWRRPGRRDREWSQR